MLQREKGAVAFLVEAELPDKALRINITVREKQIEKIDRLAREAGMTRSAYLVQSALHARFQVTKSTGRFDFPRQVAKPPAMAAQAAKKITRRHKRA